MNVFLLTDLEGIAGVTDIEFVDKTNEKYKTACGLLDESINLAVDTCFASGAVKRAVCRNEATDYENADEILVRTVRDALADYQRVAPYRMDEPATVDLTFYRTDFCEDALARSGAEVERVDARTLRRKVAGITRYEELKF